MALAERLVQADGQGSDPGSFHGTSRSGPTMHYGLAALVTGAVYLAIAFGCVSLARLGEGLATVWLPVSIAIALLMRWRPRPLWPVLVALLVAASAVQLITGRSPAVALGMGLGSTTEAAVALWLINRFAPATGTPTLREAILTMVFTVLVAPLFSAGIGAIALSRANEQPYLSLAAGWWGISAWGSAVVMPFAMTVSRTALRRLSHRRRLVRLGLAGLAAIVITILAFSYTSYPFIIVAMAAMASVLWFNALRAAIVGALAVATVVALQLSGLLGTQEVVARFFSAALVSVVPFLLAVQRDELARSEQAMRRSEALFRRAMQNSAIGLALVGIDGRFLQVNDALCRLLGYDRETLLGRTFLDVTMPEDQAESAAASTQLLAGAVDAVQIEKRYRRSDGSAVWAGLVTSLVHDTATGEPEYFISQVQDIGERRHAQQQLAEAESRWHFALESARQGVWDSNLRTGEHFVSGVWKSLLGFGDDEFDSHAVAWSDLVHPDDRGALADLERRCVTGNQDMFEAEFRMRHKDGHWVWILDRGRVIERDDTGRAARLIGTHTDISDRRRTEEAVRALNERFRLAMTAAEVGLFEYDAGQNRVLWDERLYRLYRCDQKHFGGHFADWAQRVHRDDLARMDREFEEMARGERVTLSDHRIVRDDGVVRYIHTVGQFIPARGEQSPRVIGVQWDVTPHTLLNQALAEEKERLRITLTSIGDGVICTDAVANITFMNPVAEQLTGWTLAEAEGQPVGAVFALVHEDDGRPFDDPVWEVLHSHRTVTTQEGALLVNRRDDRFSVHQTTAPVITAAGEVVGTVLIFQDVTGARALQKALAYAANHDALTGLPNRTAFETVLTDLSLAAGHDGRQHALAYIDLDRFKIVNDTAGHAAGDALLREAARTLKAALPANDVVARLGGDEFGVLLLDSGVDEADAACRSLIEALGRLRFYWEGRTYDIGASVGLTAISGPVFSADELMKQADVACYAAKAAGRNRVSLYTAGAGDAERHYREIHVAAGIRAALESSRFRLYAQEIRDLSPGARHRTRYEILLRMIGENGEVMPPGTFIPAAERYDLMGIIDRWVIATLLRAYRDDLRRHPSLEVTINLSANSLSDPLLWPFVHNEIRISGIAPARLHFEITETALVNNFSVAREFVAAVRATGAKVVLDDFGTGLSSFAYLKQFQVDCIKIDGSFVRHMTANPVDRRIVESINDIGHALGLSTVAEFVENESTLEAVRAIGIDQAQGYCIGRPLPLSEILQSGDA